jgi:RNA polymerase sigma-70 factor (sigma-E family)
MVSDPPAGSRLEILYLRHGPDALRLAYLLTGDRELAEDITQEAFVRVARRLTGLRNADSFWWYLRRTVVNLSNSHLRRRKVERAHLRRLVGTGAAASASSPDMAARHAVRGAIERLPVRQRAVVVLRYYEDLTDQQIASTLGWPLGSVKSALHPAWAVATPGAADLVAAGRSLLYVAAGDVPHVTLSAYDLATGQLIDRIGVPGLPTALATGPGGSVWLAFGPGVTIGSVAADGSGAWIATGPQSVGQSAGAVIRLDGRLRVVTPRSVAAYPAFAFAEQVWSSGSTVVVSTDVGSRPLVCFRFRTGAGPVTSLGARLPPVALALALAGDTAYAADARGVITYHVPAACR